MTQLTQKLLLNTNYQHAYLEKQEEKGLFEIIKDVVLKILYEIGRLFKSLDVNLPDKEIRKNINIQRVINFDQLNPSIITEYSSFIEAAQTIWSYNLDQAEIGDKNFVFIPVVLRGRFRKHIVSFIYDKEKETLYYFDSNGDGIERNGNRTVVDNCGSDLRMDKTSKKIVYSGSPDQEESSKPMTLKDMANKIVEKIGNPNIKLKEKTQKMQKDGYSCGVFTLIFLKRIAGKVGTFEQLSITPDALRAMRKEILTDLYGNLVTQKRELDELPKGTITSF